MTQPVYILGGHQTDFAKVWSRNGQDISDMTREATLGALAAAGVDAAQVESIHVGNAFGELQRQQAHLGAMVAQMVPELWGVPAMRHEGACASSSLGVLAAMAEIEAGRYDCVLVLGVEEFKNLPGDQASQNQNAADWQGPRRHRLQVHVAGRLRPAGAGVRAPLRPGPSPPEPHRRINYGNAKRNLLAQTRKWNFDPFELHRRRRGQPGHRARHAAPGLWPDHRRRLRPCCWPRSAFAPSTAAVMAALAPLARIAGWGHRNAGLRLKDKAGAQRGPGHMFPHLRQTIEGRLAARRRGRHRGHGWRRDARLLHHHRVHGHRPPGPHPRPELAGRGGRRIERGGSCPINMSGGLIGCGHPVGATGTRMLLDAARQVTGQAGECQIEGARRLQTLNIGGSCATVVSFVVQPD